MKLNPNDVEHLRNAILSNSANLFLGAGFSSDASNTLGENIPVGQEFAKVLWQFLGYSGDYDGSQLQQVFDAALAKKKSSDIQTLLNQCFRCVTIPDWYSLATKFFWRRIFTTNVDDVIETAFQRFSVRQRLKVINGISDDYQERDLLLEEIQYVKLNGTLTDNPKSITFSARQYASRLVENDTWYDQFVREYSTRVTVFIGTKLNEPLLFRAIESRGRKYGQAEHGPRSYVICRSFSPVDEDTLREFRVVPIEGSAKEFFELLAMECSPIPSLEDVLLKANPGLEGMLKIMGKALNDRVRSSIRAFYEHFSPVSLPSKAASVRKLFLHGAEPQWGDIYNELDAPREFTHEIIQLAKQMHAGEQGGLLALSGSAGSGKSTALKRAALTLSSLGHLVFFSNCEELPQAHLFENAIDAMPARPVIFFDNAHLAFGQIGQYLASLKRTSRKALLVITARTHPLVDIVAEWKTQSSVAERRVPDLSSKDVDSILDKLDQHNLLGKLAGLDRNKQRDVFLSYARRQVLVAMRAATLGKGFDEIIKDEFLHITPIEAQMVYLCASIAMAAGFNITRQELLSCSGVQPVETLGYIQHALRDLLIPVSEGSDSLSVRHKVIAELVVDDLAPREMLRQAYTRLLLSLSHGMQFPADTKTRTFKLYRSIINHTSLYKRFRSNIEHARAIFSASASNLKREHHFWLQFGSLELEYGELSDAANYLEQAHSFAPDDNLVLTTRAQLRYKQSCAAPRLEAALILRDEAREILKSQMERRPKDHYPVHVYCTQELAWIKYWLPYNREKKPAVEELLEFAKRVEKEHTFSPEIRDMVKQVRSAHLDLAKP